MAGGTGVWQEMGEGRAGACLGPAGKRTSADKQVFRKMEEDTVVYFLAMTQNTLESHGEKVNSRPLFLRTNPFYFLFNKFKFSRGTALHGFCVQWP